MKTANRNDSMCEEGIMTCYATEIEMTRTLFLIKPKFFKLK